jgi:hypothetical protein
MDFIWIDMVWIVIEWEEVFGGGRVEVKKMADFVNKVRSLARWRVLEK